MKVQEIMTREVQCCGAATDLAAVAMIMWRTDCGVVPVLADGSRRVTGMLTDRDICMAVATQHRPAAEIPAGSVAAQTVHGCRPGDSVRTALETMATHQVRRLPVLNADGELEGIVSLADLVLRVDPAGARRAGALSPQAVQLAHRRICTRRAPREGEGPPPGKRSARVAREVTSVA